MTEIDWTKIPVDTPVLYKVHPDQEWQPGYFCGYNSIEPSVVRVWYEEKTSRTSMLSQSTCECKLDPSAKSIINWIPNTGVRPECKMVLVRFNCGKLDVDVNPSAYDWDVSNAEYAIKEYAIIE